MSNDEIINVIKKYVKGVCENDSTGHDWWHIQRVYNNAMQINKKENANEFLITVIVLMHDLYDHKFYNGDVKEALEDTLQKLDVYNYISKEDAENIIHSCINLGFSSNITDVKELITSLMNGEEDQSDAQMGVEGYMVTETQSKSYNIPIGFYISNIVENSGADKAGLEIGYIITEIEGNQVENCRKHGD